MNQAVKRNLHRFPEDFMFQLTGDEVEELRNSSQLVMSLRKHRGVSYRPYAFTEHGAVMLASVLNSPKAIEASLQVVRAFVRLRTILTEHQELTRRIEELEEKFVAHDKNFKGVFTTLRQIISALPKPAPKLKTKRNREIGFLSKEKQKLKTKK